MNITHSPVGHSDKIGRIELFRIVSDINKMMGKIPEIFRGRFGASDIKFSVNLNGIDIDYLPPAPEQFHDKIGFTDGCGTEEENKGDFISCSCTQLLSLQFHE